MGEETLRVSTVTIFSSQDEGDTAQKRHSFGDWLRSLKESRIRPPGLETRGRGLFFKHREAENMVSSHPGPQATRCVVSGLLCPHGGQLHSCTSL